MSHSIEQLAQQLLKKQWRLSVAESCTGGMLAAACTDLSGSSQWFERAYVTYSNLAKHQCLSVPLSLLDRYGAVSHEVAEAMVAGVLTTSHTDVAIATTGIAGPSGATDSKPIGLVFIAIGIKKGTIDVSRHYFQGCRAAVRQQSVTTAIELLLAKCSL